VVPASCVVSAETVIENTVSQERACALIRFMWE
jgi:hypothetical protein